MCNYGIIRVEKRKMKDLAGICKENNRTATTYKNDVKRSISDLNESYLRCNNYENTIKDLCEEREIKIRSNSTVALDFVISYSPDALKDQQEIDAYFSQSYYWLIRYGIPVSAVVHYDETTPHLHVLVCPITPDNHLSASAFIGQKYSLDVMQNEFYSDICFQFGLDRGTHSKKKHKEADIWRLEQKLEQLRFEEKVEREFNVPIDWSEREKIIKEIEHYPTLDEITDKRLLNF